MGFLSIAERDEGGSVQRAPCHQFAPSDRPGSSDNSPDIAVATDADALMALESDWRALERRSARPYQVFQSFDWCAAWVQTCAGKSNNIACIVTARIDGHLVLVWPLMQVRMGPLTVLRWFSDPYSQYGDALIDPGTDRECVLGAAWRHIRALPGIDAIRLRHVRSDAAVAGFLARQCRPAGDVDSAPCLDLAEYPDEAAYEKRYSKTQRRRRKRIRQELEQHGPLEFRVLRAGDEFNHLVDAAITEKRLWIEARGLHSRPLANPCLGEFIRGLAGGSDLEVVLAVLGRGPEVIAYEIGLRYRAHHFGYITAHDHRLTDTSPARLHMDLSQRRAITDGMRVFDLMVPGDPHKVSWSNRSIAVFDLYAPLTVLGRLYGLVYLEGIRPLLRRTYYAAAPWLRRHVKRLTGC